MTAITATTNKFGPSGSLKSANSVLEHMSEVKPRIMSEYFFDAKSIFVGILFLTRSEGWRLRPDHFGQKFAHRRCILFSRNSYNTHRQWANIQHLFSTIVKGSYPKVVP